jgi:hypothetical protein
MMMIDEAIVDFKVALHLDSSRVATWQKLDEAIVASKHGDTGVCHSSETVHVPVCCFEHDGSIVIRPGAKE